MGTTSSTPNDAGAGAGAGNPTDGMDPNICIHKCAPEIARMKECIDSLPKDGEAEAGDSGQVALSKCIVHVAAWKECCERAKYEVLNASIVELPKKE